MKYVLLLTLLHTIFIVSQSDSISYSESSDDVTSFATTLLSESYSDSISVTSLSESSDSDSAPVYYFNAGAVSGVVDDGSASIDSSDDAISVTAFGTTLLDLTSFGTTLSESDSYSSDSDSNDDSIPITFAAGSVSGVVDGSSSIESESQEVTTFASTLFGFITTLSESYSADSDSNEIVYMAPFAAGAVSGVVDSGSASIESESQEVTTFASTLFDLTMDLSSFITTLSESYSADSDSNEIVYVDADAVSASIDDGIVIGVTDAPSYSSDSSSEDYFASTLLADLTSFATTLLESYSADSDDSDDSGVINIAKRSAAAGSIDDPSVDSPGTTELDDDDDDLDDTETDSDDESLDSDTSADDDDASTSDEGLIAQLFGRNSQMSSGNVVENGEEDVEFSLSKKTWTSLWAIAAGFTVVNMLIVVAYYALRKKAEAQFTFDESNNV